MSIVALVMTDLLSIILCAELVENPLQNNRKFTIQNYLIHLIYAGTLLLAVAAVIGYLIWNQYHLEMQAELKANKQAIAQKEVIQLQAIKEEKAAKQQALHDSEIKQQLASCLLAVREEYSTAWANACIATAKDISNNLANCITQAKYYANSMENPSLPATIVTAHNMYLSRVANCKSIYGNSDPSPNCRLPLITANAFNAEYTKNEELAQKLASKVLANHCIS